MLKRYLQTRTQVFRIIKSKKLVFMLQIVAIDLERK